MNNPYTGTLAKFFELGAYHASIGKHSPPPWSGANQGAIIAYARGYASGR